MSHKKHRKSPAKSRVKDQSEVAPTAQPQRSSGFGIAAGIGAVAAIVIGLLGIAWRSGRGRVGNAEHPAPDLAADALPIGSGRAPDAFRPDPTAPVPESEREGLRPATGPAPSLSAIRGEMANQTGASNG